MPISANARYDVAPAPGSLVLVQELLNTCARGRGPIDPDLLDDAAQTRSWADGMLDRLDAPRAPITPVDVAALREMRDAIRTALHLRAGQEDETPVAVREPVTLDFGTDGQATYGMSGRPSTVIRGAVLAEILLAQAKGEWARLKLCQLPPCDLAFYDTSRNHSARWHTERCGNYVNLTQSRERRRQAKG